MVEPDLKFLDRNGVVIDTYGDPHPGGKGGRNGYREQEERDIIREKIHQQNFTDYR